jgi:hypothetical protein
MGRVVSFALAIFVFVLTACGGGGDDSAGPKSTSEPKPSQPITAAMGAYDKAIAADSCKEYQALVFSLIRQRPAGSATTRSECPAGSGVPLALHGRRFDSSREYGTGAVIEGSLPPGNSGRKEVSVWVLDGDRHFHSINFYGALDPQLGTRGSLSAARGVTERFIAATRAKDCAAMEPLLNTKGRLVVSNGSTSAACKVVLGGVFFAPAVQKGPAPEADPTGATRDFAFVGIPTAKSYFTAVVSDVGGGAAKVLDILPNTPVKFPPSGG